jgi:protein-disulfide isomerase
MKIYSKYIKLFKIFSLLIVLSSLISNNSYAEDTSFFIGKSDAPVKIKVFSSFTCPHCANFHMKIIPEIEKNFVSSGKVQITFIDFPLDQAAFNASKLLNCIDKKNKMKFMDAIYKNQDRWTSGSDLETINNNLKQILKDLNLDSVKFNDCLMDEKISDKILVERIDAQKKYSVSSTPTIVINEKKVDNPDFENIKSTIESLI